MILNPGTKVWLQQVLFSPDGRFAATKSLKHEVFVWGMDEPDRPVRWARSDYATGLAFTPDGRLLAISYESMKGRHRIILWDHRERKEVRTFFPDGPATGLRGSAGWRSRRTAVGWSRATWP